MNIFNVSSLFSDTLIKDLLEVEKQTKSKRTYFEDVRFLSITVNNASSGRALKTHIETNAATDYECLDGKGLRGN